MKQSEADGASCGQGKPHGKGGFWAETWRKEGKESHDDGESPHGTGFKPRLCLAILRNSSMLAGEGREASGRGGVLGSQITRALLVNLSEDFRFHSEWDQKPIVGTSIACGVEEKA